MLNIVIWCPPVFKHMAVMSFELICPKCSQLAIFSLVLTHIIDRTDPFSASLLVSGIMGRKFDGVGI